MVAEPDGVIDFGATPSSTQTLSGVGTIDALLIGSSWTDASLTFSFPDSATDYNYASSAPSDTSPADFSALSAAQVTSARYWLDQYAAVSGLSFTELDGTPGAQDEDQEATIRFANTSPANAPRTSL